MQADKELTERIKRQMNRMPIHETWEAAYRTPASEKTTELCLDRLVKLLKQPADSKALDIGCGIAANSVRLAKRGYRVTAGDYSDVILEPARNHVAEHQLSNRVEVRHEDMLDLSFANDTFDLTFCWGVLMLSPEPVKAIGELARVTRPGGYLVFEEINPISPESKAMRFFWQAFRGRRIQSTRNETGFEQTAQFTNEQLLWRHTDPAWLEEQLRFRLCEPVRKIAGTLSDAHLFLKKNWLRNMVHRLNRFWVKRIGWARLAYHNVYVFRKEGESQTLLPAAQPIISKTGRRLTAA